MLTFVVKNEVGEIAIQVKQHVFRLIRNLLDYDISGASSEEVPVRANQFSSLSNFH